MCAVPVTTYSIQMTICRYNYRYARFAAQLVYLLSLPITYCILCNINCVQSLCICSSLCHFACAKMRFSSRLVANAVPGSLGIVTSSN